MSVVRKSIRVTRITTRASPYHPSVTLFEPGDLGDDIQSQGTTSKTRSKRAKPDQGSSIPDLEDAVLDGGRQIGQTAGVSTEESVSRRAKMKRSSTSSSRTAKPIRQALDTPHPAPENWLETYNAIKEMRTIIKAPVDTMGCDQAQYKETDPKSQRFATLVSLMLSSQTKDEVTDAAVSNLRTALGGSLSVEAVIQADEATISNAINKVGFWRRKTQYLKQAAMRLRDDFDSDVPKTVDELCSLPGVGPKMAFLTLQVAWNLNSGIGVDVHVHRITNRLGWHKPPTKSPEETRLNLQSWLPSEYHREINHLLVGFGQTICLPTGPRCDQCDLSIKNFCPSARKLVKKRRVKAMQSSDIDDDQAKSGPSLGITWDAQTSVDNENEVEISSNTSEV